jgi:hypothetical protein
MIGLRYSCVYGFKAMVSVYDGINYIGAADIYGRYPIIYGPAGVEDLTINISAAG